MNYQLLKTLLQLIAWSTAFIYLGLFLLANYRKSDNNPEKVCLLLKNGVITIILLIMVLIFRSF